MLAVALVVAAAGCGSGTRTATLVPWANRRRPPYRIPDARLIRYPAGAPPCRADELRVRRGRTGAATGHVLEELVFVNVGRRPCLLRGYPRLSAETPSGERVVLHPRHGTFFGALLAADLPPGGHVYLDVETSDVCRDGRAPVVHYRRLVFTLPTGGRVRGGKATIVEQCGLAISELGLPRRYRAPRAARGSAGALHAIVQAPNRARAGTTLRFTVTLANPTSAPVALRPCPGYTEALFAGGVATRHSYTLSCDAIHAVAPHSRVRYAMELGVPRSAPPGLAKLGWSLDTPTCPFAATVLRVVR